jgi:ubiquinone/menaquinone biosynthesis C-methylase UbiE
MKKRLIKILMRLKENEISFDNKAGAVFGELFNHPKYLKASKSKQIMIGLDWANELYKFECNHPLDLFFPGIDLASYCDGAAMLDIGCGLGGRSLRWLEKYHGKSIHGIDIGQKYINLSKLLAKKKDAAAEFIVGSAEQIPFAEDTFRVIFHVNTFEHVRNIIKALLECHRVLKPGGYMIVFFPGFYYPLGHHLNLVTNTPCLHWFFKYESLLEAYFSIMDDRGEMAEWYRRKEEKPLPFEKGYSINGISANQFFHLIKEDWHIIYDNYRHARGSFSQNPSKRFLDKHIKKLQLLLLRELFHNAFVLQKR